MEASVIFKNFVVRKFLLKIQMDFSKRSSVVVDERGIGIYLFLYDIS